MACKIEDRREFLETLVCQLIGKGFAVADAFFQHFAHVGLGVDHVVQPEGLHGVAIDFVIAKKVID